MEKQWVVIRGKQKFGPFTTDRLKQLAADNKLKPSDTVRHTGTNKSSPASQINGLFINDSAPAAIMNFETDETPLSVSVRSARRTQQRKATPFRLLVLSAIAVSVFILFIGGAIFIAAITPTSKRIGGGAVSLQNDRKALVQDRHSLFIDFNDNRSQYVGKSVTLTDVKLAATSEMPRVSENVLGISDNAKALATPMILSGYSISPKGGMMKLTFLVVVPAAVKPSVDKFNVNDDLDVTLLCRETNTASGSSIWPIVKDVVRH